MAILGGIKGILFTIFKSKALRLGLFTTIALIFLLFGSLMESIEQRSLEPILDEFGQQILGIDVKIGESTNVILQLEDVTWKQKLSAWFTLLSQIWILWFLGEIIFRIWHLKNTSEVFWTLLFTLITLAVLQLLYDKSRFPFTGLWHFISNIPHLSHPIRNWSNTTFSNYTTGSANLTQNITV